MKNSTFQECYQNLLSDNEQNKNEWKYEEKFHIQNKNDEESHIEIKNESNITNDSLLNYFKINNLTFEEKENYITLYSNYTKIKYEKIIKLHKRYFFNRN